MTVVTASADYGELGPEHFDRLGVRHHVDVTVDVGTRSQGTRTYVDADPRGRIQRLGLTLWGWWKQWPGMEVFRLDIWGRPMEIRSYSDGRIKIFLDDQEIYVEKTKVVTEHGEKRRAVTQWFDPAAETVEDPYEARERRLDAVRERLGSIPFG